MPESNDGFMRMEYVRNTLINYSRVTRFSQKLLNNVGDPFVFKQDLEMLNSAVQNYDASILALNALENRIIQLVIKTDK